MAWYVPRESHASTMIVFTVQSGGWITLYNFGKDFFRTESRSLPAMNYTIANMKLNVVM